MEGDIHPIFDPVLATIRPPAKLAGGAELAVHGDAEDVLAQVGKWVGRFGMISHESAHADPITTLRQKDWFLRRPRELLVDVTEATGLPGPAGMRIDVYPEGGTVPEIPITVRLVRLQLLGEPARDIATFEFEGGD